MIKIGVLGSCVSRDNFYSKFIPNYKEYYECVFHQNQMSMISLVSNAIHVDNTKINNIKPFDKKHFITELDKSFWNTLIVNKPHYLIVDLYGDVRFGAIQVENTFITNKEFVFKKTDLYSQLNLGEKLNINDNPEKFFEAWKKSVDIFMRTLQRKLPNCKVIINKARFIDEYIDKKTNEVKKISTSGKQIVIDVDLYNKWLDILDGYIIENYNVKYIDYGDNKYKSVEDHPWGMYYVHYESKYYYDFKDKLLAIIIKDIQEELEATRKNEKEILYHEDMKENLIVNSDFNLANDFWSYWDNDFKIIPLYIDGKLENILNLNKSDLVTDKYKQVWSNSIEINTNGDKEFQLSFDIKVDKISKVDSLGNIFCIRTFNELDKIFNKDCVWNKFINISEIQGLENSKWTTFTCRIKPEKGKFMKISPFLTRNGDVSWKNIKLSLIN